MGTGALPATAETRRTGVITALTVEARTLARRRLSPGQQLVLRSGAHLAVCGSGANSARASTQILIDQGVEMVISWGTAGGLAHWIPPGALLVPNRILAHDGDEHAIPDALHRAFTEQLSQCAPVHADPLVEAPRVVANPRDKARLHHQCGAGSVDMESAAIARIASEARIPFIVIRTVVDHASTTLPEAAQVAVTDAGAIHWPALGSSLWHQPGQIPALLRLAGDMRRAQRTLRRAGRALGLC